MPPSISRTPDFSNQIAFSLEVREIGIPLLLKNVCRRSLLNRSFYSYVLSCQAFEWKWGWSWPCFDRNLTPFHMQITTN